MPLEILEMVVKASVNETNAAGGSGGGAGGQGEAKKDELIAECVERVLEILDEKKER